MTAHLERDVADVARKWVPDTRLGVFEVTVQPGALAGCTTSRDALAALRRVAAGARLAADIRLLPDSSVGDEQAAVVTAAVAPLVREPRVNADRVSEAVHGETLEVLERRSDTWLRVRAGDGYLAWVHPGYVSLGTTAWAEDWVGRATVRSLGADLRCEGARFRLAVGARAAPQRGGRVETADGRVWDVAAGVLRPEIELLVQATYAARGVTLPRDSDLLSGAGRDVPLEATGGGYEAGDVLCFADGRRISHVALWAGAGRIVHSALSRGGVVADNLLADTPAMRR